MIDWSKLKTYDKNKYRSFEELCYQIAKGLHGNEGDFTSIDDSGGGDGVEFYLTLPNGDEWGWQAKFYYPDPRLSKSGRKRAIRGSLKKACEKHERLKRWILCTPTDFTVEERDWFKETLCESIPENVDVELKHWQASDFNDWLSEQRFNGKLNYFFSELELDFNWFKRQSERQMVFAAKNFDVSLYTETEVDAHIRALLGNTAFARQFTKWIKELEGEFLLAKRGIDALKRRTPNVTRWDEDQKSKVIRAAELLQTTLMNTINQFKEAEEFLNKKEISKAQAIDFGFGRLKQVFDDYEKLVTEPILEEYKRTGELSAFIPLYDEKGPVPYPNSSVAAFFRSRIQLYQFIKQPDLHIFGKAQTGKTYLACNICHNQLKNGLPALFISGRSFSTDQLLEERLQGILDILPSHSWNDFLQALSAVAEAYHTRIPLIIDGLNESMHNDVRSNTWQLGLERIIYDISQTKNIVLITTCRTSYKKYIWPDEDPSNVVHTESLDIYREYQAIEKYFSAYKIKAEFPEGLFAKFTDFIYLQIFCESRNSAREVERHIYAEEQSVFEVFEEYVKECEKALCKRLDPLSEECIVQPAVNKMAAYLWEHRCCRIPRKELVLFVDGQSRENPRDSSSKTYAIEDEAGLLIHRDYVDDTEVVGFTYDPLGGYLIAKYLVQQASNDVKGFLCSEKTVTSLFCKNSQTLHPLHQHISSSLAVLLPERTGQFLHELLDNEIAFDLSIRALFEISPQNINEQCIALVVRYFQNPEMRKRLLSAAEITVGHPDHPLNASFWSNQLSALSMPERDLSWTNLLAPHQGRLRRRIMYFQKTCQNYQELSGNSKARLHLLAEYIMWMLTSTVRPLRNMATHALYLYGQCFPQEFLALVMKSLSINDPYVPERMLAATCGIAMARQHDSEDPSFARDILPSYGRELYNTMFKPDAPHPTTHILARDYARRTIDIALEHHTNLLTDDERNNIMPPFTSGGIREWGSESVLLIFAQDSLKDFEEIVLTRLVRDRSSYEDVRENIFWRMEELGYSRENFKEIDQRIASENRTLNSYLTDSLRRGQYIEKYAWIAFYELAGFKGEGFLRDDYIDIHILRADIDPSSSDGQREYELIKRDLRAFMKR